MHTTRKLALVAAMTLAVTALDCDGTGPGGGLPIVISATWVDEDDDNHAITFRSPDDGLSSGVLAGREEHPDCANQCSVGGFWRNRRIEITIDRLDERPKFEAEYDVENPTRLEFTQIGGSEAFTLVQP